jgi:hypothetical protein
MALEIRPPPVEGHAERTGPPGEAIPAVMSDGTTGPELQLRGLFEQFFRDAR